MERETRPARARPAAAEPRRILLVEDEPRVRELMRLFLERAGFAVTGIGDGHLALESFDEDPPDLIVVDLGLPGLAGEALIEAIREVSTVPIVVASAKRTDRDRIDAFRRGVDDYVTKPFNPVELVARVQAILRRVGPIDARSDRRLSFADGRLVVEPMVRRFVCDGRAGRLTPTETRVLLGMASTPGIVVDRERLLAIATRGTSETTRTVDVHVANLRRKLGDDAASPWAIETVPQAGYRWIATPDREDRTGTARPAEATAP